MVPLSDGDVDGDSRLDPISLSGGLVLRAATPHDVERIVALQVTTFGISDEPGVRGNLGATFDGSPTIGDWTLVADGDRIVASSVLIGHHMSVDGTPFRSGQVEYVATDPEYRRRGLVRRQFDWHHRRAAERGDLALFIAGIPYLYRKFGYGYGLDFPALVLAGGPDAADPAGASGSVPLDGDDLSLRPATVADLDAIGRLDATRPTAGLRVDRDAEAWATIAAICAPGTYERLVVATRRELIVGWIRTQAKPEDGRVYLSAAAVAPDEPPATAQALLDRARAEAVPHLLVVFDRPDTPFGAHVRSVLGDAALVRHDHGVYVRVPDPVALLDALRPVLSERFAASRYADRDGEVEISLYERGIVLELSGGAVTAVRDAPGIEDPFAHEGIGVPPDAFGALVFGRWGAIGLEQRTDDVVLGRRRGLMEALFPPRPSDVVGDF